MTSDRRSHKSGIAASLPLFAGLSAGILPTTHFGWLPVANGNPPAAAVNAGSPGESPSNFVNVVKAATPAVVNISITRVIRQRPGETASPFMDDPFFASFSAKNFSANSRCRASGARAAWAPA